MRVFVSYQRADTLLLAHALHYALRLGGHEPFVDTGSIASGEAYRERIASEIERSELLLALIGPKFDFARLAEPGNVIAFEWRRANFHRVPVAPVLFDGARLPSDDQLPAQLRWSMARNALLLRSPSLAGDIDACVARVPELGGLPRRAARVLWVDDKPAGNERERRMLREHGVVFDNVVSSEEALEQIDLERYELILTDLGRLGSSDVSESAGLDLLQELHARKDCPPVVVYTSLAAARAFRAGLLERGASDVLATPSQLLARVLELLGRSADSEPVSER
jgi:CheY-like chemotaxis protein